MPFKLDALPQKAQQAVLDAREGRCVCNGPRPHSHTWEETAALASRVAGTNISAMAAHRWYDVRHEQRRAETLARNEKVQELVAMFERLGLKNLPAATLNALAGESFALAEAGSPAEKLAALGNLLALQSGLMKAQASREKVELEREKLEARRAASEATSPREVYLAATEELLKKLRTRKAVREVLDPIQKDLIEELSRSAESFAKRIEARQA